MTTDHASPEQAARLSASIEAAEHRRTEFVKAIPLELSRREDTIQRKLASENASPRNKLQKIYSLMTELVKTAEPYVACSNGCSACCKMNVMISQFEANFIEKATGIKPKQVTSSLLHPQDKFIGIPCPFLKDDSCSIYDARPFACRKHLCFDKTSYWCDLARTLDVEFPMLGFSGAEDAFFDVTQLKTGGVFADIRDFFLPH